MAWLRRGVGLPQVAAAVAAFVFAFSTIRLKELVHLQLTAQFWSLLAVAGVTLLIRAPRGRHATLATGMVVLGLVLELWSSFYHGYLTGLGLGLLAVSALFFPDARRRLWEILRAQAMPLAMLTVVGAALLWPLASHYLETVQLVGLRSARELQGRAPTLGAWINTGPQNLLWGWAMDPATNPLISTDDRVLNPGLITLGAGIAGLAMARRQLGVVMVALFLLVALTTVLPGGLHGWLLVFDHLPGASAIRALYRVTFVVLIPVVLGVGLLLARLRHRTAWAVGLGSLMMIEQARVVPTFPRLWSEASVAELASLVQEKDCEAFFYSPVIDPSTQPRTWWEHHWVRFQTDAMLAQQLTGRPTINGYHGNRPPGWAALQDPALRAQDDATRVNTALARWAFEMDLDLGALCWLHMTPTARP